MSRLHDGRYPNKVYKVTYPKYTRTGNVMRMDVDLQDDNAPEMQYFYTTYDDFNRLHTVSYNLPATSGAFITDATLSGSHGVATAGQGKVAEYTYDDAKGLVTKLIYFDNNPSAACANTVSSDVPIDKTTYAYDLRSRLTQIDSKLFNWTMQYDGTDNYNGNINSTTAVYKTQNLQNSANCLNFATANSYTYTYDGLNRLTQAQSNFGLLTMNAGLGNEKYSYDKIGNIKRLDRTVYEHGALSGSGFNVMLLLI